MKIEKVNFDKLIPYENNPRKNDEAIKYIKQSIEDFGYLNPIIVNKDYVIICGHTRYKALQQMNVDLVDVIVIDDLTKEQEKLFRLADNKVAEYSKWDYEKVLEESAELIDNYLGKYGFEYHSLEDLNINEDEYLSEENIEEKYIICPYCGEKVE